MLFDAKLPSCVCVNGDGDDDDDYDGGEDISIMRLYLKYHSFLLINVLMDQNIYRLMDY